MIEDTELSAKFYIAPERPDWNHWLKMTIVTIKEACWLLVNVDPRYAQNNYIHHKELRSIFIEIQEYYQVVQVIQSSLFSNELNFIPCGKNYIDGMVKLVDFAEWAKIVGYEIPAGLEKIFDKEVVTPVGFENVETTDLEEKTEIEPYISSQASNKKKVVDNQVVDDWNSKNEREYTYRTIGALILFLIEKTDGKKFGTRRKPLKKSIYDAIGDLLSGMGLSEEGQKKTRLNKVLNEALDLVFKKPLS